MSMAQRSTSTKDTPHYNSSKSSKESETPGLCHSGFFYSIPTFFLTSGWLAWRMGDYRGSRAIVSLDGSAKSPLVPRETYGFVRTPPQTRFWAYSERFLQESSFIPDFSFSLFLKSHGDFFQLHGRFHFR